jgi:hypothetical protein
LFVQDAAPGVQSHDCGVQSSSFCAHQKLIGPAGEEVKVSIKKEHQMALCSTCLFLFQCWWPGHCCVPCSDRMSGPLGGLYWLTRFPGKGIFKEIISQDLLRPAMLLVLIRAKLLCFVCKFSLVFMTIDHTSIWPQGNTFFLFRRLKISLPPS